MERKICKTPEYYKKNQIHLSDIENCYQWLIET